MLRSVISTGDALAPTAFLRQSGDFPRVLNAQNPLGTVLDKNGLPSGQWPIDESGRSLTTESTKLFNYTGTPLWEDPQQKGKPFFTAMAAGCFDQDTLT